MNDTSHRQTEICVPSTSEEPESDPAGSLAAIQPGAPAQPLQPETSERPLFASASLSSGSHLAGIGGWLILVAIQLVFTPLSCMHGIYVDLRILYSSRFEMVLTGHSGLQFLILFEAATNTIFLLALAGLNVLFYRTRKSFPKLMITYLAVHLVLISIDHFSALTLHLHTSMKAVAQGAIATAIWIPYYRVSERVKATFVR